MVKCISQLFRPKEKIPSWIRGMKGDCTTCQPCEKNKDCPCYTPVSLMVVEIIEKVS